jgi:hypothetical protein
MEKGRSTLGQALPYPRAGDLKGEVDGQEVVI